MTWRASSRVWLAAYSCAPGSCSTWQSEADSFSAPCSPCRIDENDHSVSRLASLILLFLVELVADGGLQIAVQFRIDEIFVLDVERRAKSMYFLSSGSQK